MALYVFMLNRDLNKNDYVPAGVYTTLAFAKWAAEAAEGEPLEWREINGIMAGYLQSSTLSEYASAMIYYIHTIDQNVEVDKKRPDMKVRAILNKG